MRLTYILIFWWVQSYDPFLDYRKHKPPHLLRSHLNSVQPPASRHHWDSRCRWALWFVDPTTHVSQPILPIHHRPTKINPKPILFCFEQKRKKNSLKCSNDHQHFWWFITKIITDPEKWTQNLGGDIIKGVPMIMRTLIGPRPKVL